MGKWAEVHCTCANRVPLPNSDFLFGRPYRNKKRLTKREQAEVDEWKRTTENMFACGHRHGMIVEFAPDDIIHLGYLLDRIVPDNPFQVFAKVGDWRHYDDELLLIQPEEANLWLLEIEEIQKAFEGSTDLSQNQFERLILEFYRADLGSRLQLEARLDEIAAKIPMAPVAALKRNLQQGKRPDIESAIENITKAISDAAKLCHASIETGNPIRMLW